MGKPRAFTDSFLFDIVDNFRIEGTIGSVKPFGSGHINDTFLVKIVERVAPDYLLQRKNHYVFKDVPGMMDNIRRVTEHIRKKLEHVKDANPDREVMTLISTDSGAWYVMDADGNYWSLFLFIPDSISYDVVDDDRMAFEGGRAFGRFQRLLADLPGQPLNVTIVDFHNMAWRFDNFHKALKADTVGRAGSVQKEIDFTLAREDEMVSYYKHLCENLPERITHNDTKFNNILFDKEGKALCIIDLDTVMPGYVAYDFGDSIRTAANTGEEDDPDLDKVRFNRAVYKNFSEGFISEIREALTPEEIESIPFGARYMTFIMGIRFLTDYLEGDIYYKISDPEQNLRRVRTQHKLILAMEDHFDEMRRIVREAAGK
jgi:Ser/Thr protein kinase RdoA (MazF antagonist)